MIAGRAKPRVVKFAEILLEMIDTGDFVAGVVGDAGNVVSELMDDGRQGARRLFLRLRQGIADGSSTPMRGSRVIRTTLRTAHLLAIGALYGGHVFGQTADRLFPALIAALATGLVFMAFEVWRAPIWLVQLRGAATYLKLVLILCVSLYWEQRVAILTLVVIIGTVVSHMPARYRYYSLLHRRVVYGGESG